MLTFYAKLNEYFNRFLHELHIILKGNNYIMAFNFSIACITLVTLNMLNIVLEISYTYIDITNERIHLTIKPKTNLYQNIKNDIGNTIIIEGKYSEE